MQVPPCPALRCGIGRYRLRICHASWLPSDLRRAPSHDGSRLSRGSVRALVVCTEQLPCRSPKRLFPRHVLRVRGTSNAGVEDVYSRSLRTGGGFAPPDVPDRGVVSGRGRAMARCRRRRWGSMGDDPLDGDARAVETSRDFHAHDRASHLALGVSIAHPEPAKDVRDTLARGFKRADGEITSTCNGAVHCGRGQEQSLDLPATTRTGRSRGGDLLAGLKTRVAAGK